MYVLTCDSLFFQCTQEERFKTFSTKLIKKYLFVDLPNIKKFVLSETSVYSADI